MQRDDNIYQRFNREHVSLNRCLACGMKQTNAAQVYSGMSGDVRCHFGNKAMGCASRNRKQEQDQISNFKFVSFQMFSIWVETQWPRPGRLNEWEIHGKLERDSMISWFLLCSILLELTCMTASKSPACLTWQTKCKKHHKSGKTNKHKNMKVQSFPNAFWFKKK